MNRRLVRGLVILPDDLRMKGEDGWGSLGRPCLLVRSLRGCVHSTYAGGMGGWGPRGRTLSYGMGGWVQTLRMYKEKTGGFSLFEFCCLLQFEHHHITNGGLKHYS